MARRVIELRGDERPLLDIASYARRGPERRVSLSSAQIAQIARTVGHTPEVMVKVTRGATSSRGVIAHLEYIDRHGDLEIETDTGERLSGKGLGQQLAEDWDLPSERARARSPYMGKAGRKPARLVHNVIFSMPKGTAPEKLLAASRAFAREQFGLQHRYGLVLHTDQDHPHVHLVVKAVSEQGKRLNIRKSTLRDWRREFAKQLRDQGVPANATERAVRGQTLSPIRDGIYRSFKRGQSRHFQARAKLIVDQLRDGGLRAEPAKRVLLETRRQVQAGWLAAAEALTAAGHDQLAEQVRRFADRMRPALSTNERLALALVDKTRERNREQERVR